MCVSTTASIAFSPSRCCISSSERSRNASSSSPQSTTRAWPLSAMRMAKLGQKSGDLNLYRCGEICQTCGTLVGRETMS